MKKLDDFIRQNSGGFGFDEPAAGHMERFSKRLDQAVSIRRHQSRIMWMKIAAVLLLAVIISYVAFRESGIAGRLNLILSERPNQELNEAVRYYNSQLNIYYNRIEKLKFNNDQEEKSKVLDELSAMDEQVVAMKHDLMQNPDDERIVHAIITFYQLKIELMDVIISRAQTSTGTIL